MSYCSLPLFFCLAAAHLPLLAQNIHPKLKAKEISLGQFTIVASTVEATGKDAKGDSGGYKVREVASEVADAFENAVEAAGWKTGKDVLDPKDLKDAAAKQAVATAQTAFKELAKKIQAKPKDVAKGAFKLDSATALAAQAPGGLLVFAHTAAVLESSTSASADAGGFSISMTPKNRIKALYALVDPKTGDVLHSFPAEGRGGGILITGGLEKGIKAGLAQVPR